MEYYRHITDSINLWIMQMLLNEFSITVPDFIDDGISQASNNYKFTDSLF